MLDTEMTTGEVQEAVQTPDAGESEKKKSFDELITGDYRREYGERVEAIVKHRLKNHAETGQKLSELGAAMSVESDDPAEIIAEAMKEREGENAEVQETFSDTDTEGEESPSLDPSVISGVKELADRVKAAREYYPDLDIARELRDPEFAMLMRVTGADPKRAYEMKHHDRIMADAMQYAVRETELRLANNMAAKAGRPPENALAGGSAVMISSDPGSLTKAQRSEIKKRVRRGERVLW